MPDVFLRAAAADEQPVIRRMIRAAGLNPFGLHWPRFVVAVTAGAQDADLAAPGAVVGIGQVKILGDGTPELASLVVLPEYQGRGVGGAIVWTLIERTQGPIYLRCASYNEGYYRRFGFRTLAPAEMPRSLRRVVRFATIAVSLYNRLTGSREQLLIMARE
jgi:N-acetylglutamate synthase-like GNAT family acetyltransferase